MKNLILTLICPFLVVPCQARVITVDDDGPADFNNIQAGIDDANDGDIILVKSGYYSPSTNNESFPIVLAAGVTLQGEGSNTTTIDGETTSIVIETADNSIISGFTLTSLGYGEGTSIIECESSFVVIENNIITKYGIDCDYADNITIKNNTFTNYGIYFNYVDQITVRENRFDMINKHGTGVYLRYSTGNIINNIMHDGWDGISGYHGTANITNNLIYDNMYGILLGYGCSAIIANNNIMRSVRMGVKTQSAVQIKNNIITESGDKAVYCSEGGTNSSVSYSDFWNNNINFYNCPDAHDNIFVDPCFVDPCSGDYHLKSEGWRWDTQRKVWTWDDVTSRCIDAGNLGSSVGEELLSVPYDPNNEWGQNLRINMGAYGGTAEASMPPYNWALLADLTNDGTVNFEDYAAQAIDWLESESEQPSDLNRDGTVDIADLALLTEDWLEQTIWYVP